jgi:heme/copper-type cytochrome/quinol oxidase subunit 3
MAGVNMFYVLGAFIWVMLAFWPALVARRKGYSFILFFLLSLVFFFASLILAYVVKDKNETPEDRAADRAAEKILDEENKKL